ncbi:MAG: aspartate kinase [Opitutaceae bacterium]|nr:aspartate kinase [Cytophagales bacterium]
MKVWKFGGTSVGAPERMHSIANLINDGEKKIVVLSAVSGTTNTLVEISKLSLKKEFEAAKGKVQELQNKYLPFVENLYSTAEGKSKGSSILEEHFSLLKNHIKEGFSEVEEKLFLAQGELISTKLFTSYLQEIKMKAALLPALDFMKIDEENEPILSFTETELGKIIKQHSDIELFITQGYICRNSKGEVDNLQRGGSDFTATLIGAALYADEVQIWTDIDGMHNNDPRVVRRTYPIAEVSFDEAAELAYFGAKILHPTCIRPTQERKIPVRLLNTMAPKEKGTVITQKGSGNAFTAVAAKDGITAIKIKSTRMLNAYGFLRRVFEVFEKFKTSVDMITTSEVAVSLSVDNSKHLDAILTELSTFAIVEVDHDQTIVCVVGNFTAEQPGMAIKVFAALKEIPVRMISYGGSENNISVLIDSKYKNEALNAVNEGVFFAENISV